MANASMFEDFYQVPDLKFDIQKLRGDLKDILEKKKFNTLGISHFGGNYDEPNTGDKSSTTGHNVRGVYWTKPDDTGKEVQRDQKIDEEKYCELVPEFRNTYFEEVYNKLKKNLSLVELEYYKKNQDLL